LPVDGWVRALRLGGAPSSPDPIPARQPRRRSAGFIALGLQRFVFAMAVLKRCLEEGIDKRASSGLRVYSKNSIFSRYILKVLW